MDDLAEYAVYLLNISLSASIDDPVLMVRLFFYYDGLFELVDVFVTLFELFNFA